MERSSADRLSDNEEESHEEPSTVSMDTDMIEIDTDTMALEMAQEQSRIQANMDVALKIQLEEALNASRSLHNEDHLANDVERFIQDHPYSTSQTPDNSIEVDGEIDTSDTNGDESPFQSIQNLINNPDLLKNHPRKAEIQRILACSDKHKLLQYIADMVTQRLEMTLQRIRRKLVYIVSYRKHQLENQWIAVDATFNKYYTVHPERPIFSARSMIKLIRWCRYFEREYRPVCNVTKTIKYPDYEEHVQTLENLRTNKFPRHCFICRIDDFCQLEDGTPFCQPCLYRKMLFLHGSTLQCCECCTTLNDDKFEFWADKNWCKSCLWTHCFDNRLIEYG